MTFKKMLSVLTFLGAEGWGANGWIGVSTGGELKLTPTGQLSRIRHDGLLRRGFVYVDGDYIYRPRRK
jgi:hypothetical protein